jgi:hypothetical protein
MAVLSFAKEISGSSAAERSNYVSCWVIIGTTDIMIILFQDFHWPDGDTIIQQLKYKLGMSVIIIMLIIKEIFVIFFTIMHHRTLF